MLELHGRIALVRAMERTLGEILQKGRFIGFQKTWSSGPGQRSMALPVQINRSVGVLEYWFKKRAFNFQIFPRDLFSESDEKMGFYHYSNISILQYSANRQMPVN